MEENTLSQEAVNETPIPFDDVTEADRSQAKEEAIKESRQADMKQHADKLIQGFGKLDVNSANRAIWELVQNACDLSEQCHITIDYSNNGFAFTHNGKPFTSATLISLIKQVSNKYDDEQVGKFGTGFITTHCFGRKFEISSLLEVKGSYIKLERFLVDRSPREWRSMVKALYEQEEKVYWYIENGKKVAIEGFTTTFRYLPESETEFEYINLSETNLSTYIPIVLTLNENLKSVTVVDGNGNHKVFAKKENNVENSLVIEIKIDNESFAVHKLLDASNSVTVILPVQGKQVFEFGNNVAKLFFYYPLIGTENLGINFIIHSNQFRVTEPRDGIHLKSKNEQLKDDEEENRKLITAASNLIFEYVKDNAAFLSNPIGLARIGFLTNTEKPLLNDYFQELKATWIKNFKQFPLVETRDTDVANITPIEAAFLVNDLLEDDSYFESTYSLAEKFWLNLPHSTIAKRWTTIIDEWNFEGLKYVDVIDLVAKVSNEKELRAIGNDEHVKMLCKFLIEKGYEGHFAKYALLPNIDGRFKLFSELNDKLNLPIELIKIAKVIMPDVPARHIHDDFKFNLKLKTYSLKDYVSDINVNVSATCTDNINCSNLPEGYLASLLIYCKISSSAEANNVPLRMMKFIEGFYGLNNDLIILQLAKEDSFDLRVPQKRVARLFLNDLKKKDSNWVSDNLHFLSDVISISQNDTFSDLFLTLPAFPNQLNELCIQGPLKIDAGIPIELKELYDRVARPDKPINSILVHPLFKEYLVEPELKTPQALGTHIESIWSLDGQYTNINEHPYKTDILEVIKWITDNSDWGDYFPKLSAKRANVMLDRVSDDQIKSDVFSIINLEPTQINKLGVLARDEDFEKIIELGRNALEAEKEKDSDFEHKYAIGKHIENLLRNSLQNLLPESIKADVGDKQNGQDIVIEINGSPMYYIEVKSRWATNSPVRMSKPQTLKAFKKQEIYSLCCVDMTKYDGDNKYGVKDIAELEKCIKFNMDIGSRVSHLIEVLEQIDEFESIRLDGDVRTNIPMQYIDEGETLENFVPKLAAVINSNHAHTN